MHVSGHEWDYNCDCPSEYFVSLVKYKPSLMQTVFQGAYAEHVAQHLRRLPLLSDLAGNNKHVEEHGRFVRIKLLGEKND